MTRTRTQLGASNQLIAARLRWEDKQDVYREELVAKQRQMDKILRFGARSGLRLPRSLRERLLQVAIHE